MAEIGAPEFAIDSEDKAASFVTRCIYEIATGAWAPGQRLLPVRQAEAKWGLDRRVVMRAYQRLVDLGLAEVVDRSGYYVAGREELGRVSKHRHEMENLYERFARQIVQETELSPLGVFRYFSQYAEQKARLWPDVVFVECTATQAEGHAREVMQRLGVPCLAQTTEAIDGKRARIPAQVRTLLATGFHFGELKDLADDDLQVVSVPIEVSPTLAARMGEQPGEVVIVEHDQTEAEHLQRDVQQLDPSLRTRILLVDDIDAGLTGLFGAGKNGASNGASGSTLAMLSPRVWGSATASWQDHPDVGLIQFSVVEDAWPRIADAIGLPLGDVR